MVVRPFAVALLLIAAACAQTPSTQNTPSEPGLYTITPTGILRIEGQVISFERSGSLLVSGMTAGIKSRKINFQLQGSHSKNLLTSSPVFLYRMSPELIQQGGGPGDLVLLQMEVKKSRRQVETAAAGLWRSSKGVSLKHQVGTEVHEAQPGLFRITVPGELRTGEYGFYLFRGNILPPYFYDFSVR